MGLHLGDVAGRRLARLSLALGLLLLLAAPVLRYWVTPLLAQSPVAAGPQAALSHVSTGTITTLFDLESGGGPVRVEPIPVTVTQSTTGDVAAAEAAAATGLNVAVTDTQERAVADDGRLVSEVAYRLAADRHSQALVDCCGVQVAGVTPAMSGAGNPLRLPWLTPQATYPYFDVALLAPVELSFIGRDQVQDIEAMKFQQANAPTQVGTVAVPGRLVGSEQETVELARTHTVNRTLWVDQTTGIVLRRAERVREALRDANGKDIVTLLTMSTLSTPEQVTALVALAKAEGRPVLWTHAYGPALCLAVGGLLVMLGILGLALRARRQRIAQDFPDEWSSFDDLKETVD